MGDPRSTLTVRAIGYKLSDSETYNDLIFQGDFSEIFLTQKGELHGTG